MAFEAGEDARVLFLAMDYVEGKSLEARLKQEGPFSEEETLAISRKLSGALAYAWNRHQLLHRDIKPSNVLLDPEGEPKLVDFGLAKSLGAGAALTMTNMMMGTPNYMSPEQIEDSARVDTRADMYSLGALIYNLVTGIVPFAGTSTMEVIKKQITEILPDPREYNAGLSEGFVMLLEIMLAKDREERHACWEAVIADIDRVSDGKTPTRELPDTGGSTLMRVRDLKQLAKVKGRSPQTKLKTGKKPGMEPGGELKNKTRMKAWIWAGAGVAAGLLILAGVILLSGKDRLRPDSAQDPATTNTGAVMISENRKAPVIPETVKKIPDTPAEKAASTALIEILKMAGVGTDLAQARDLMRQIAAKGYPEADATRIKAAMAAFENAHGETVTARSQWRLLDFLKQAGPQPRPPFLQVTEENLKRVLEDLEQDNPQAAPITPVKSQVINEQASLIIRNPQNLKNISALEGFPFMQLMLSRTSISNIVPLAGTPIKNLFLDGSTAINDFTILKSMKSLRQLNLEHTRLSDLSQVVNEDLKDLRISRTAVSDLQPLKGLRLTLLYIGNTKVKDISVLADMPLATLWAENCEIEDISVLARLPLSTCWIGNPRKALDISPLEGKKMKLLGFSDEIASFAPLKTMIIEKLALRYKNWPKTPQADQLPVFLPDLESLQVIYPSEEELAIILQFPRLKQVFLENTPMTFDEFKKKYGPK